MSSSFKPVSSQHAAHRCHVWAQWLIWGSVCIKRLWRRGPCNNSHGNRRTQRFSAKDPQWLKHKCSSWGSHCLTHGFNNEPGQMVEALRGHCKAIFQCFAPPVGSSCCGKATGIHRLYLPHDNWLFWRKWRLEYVKLMLICLRKDTLRNLNSGVDVFFWTMGKDTKQISASESITLSFRIPRHSRFLMTRRSAISCKTILNPVVF